MTNPLVIDPDEVRRHASQQRIEATDWFFKDAPPPPVSPDSNDPTKQATHDFNEGVKKSRDSLHQRSTRHADGMESAADALEAQNEDNANNIAMVAPDDQSAIFAGVSHDLKGHSKVAQGIDAAGFGAIMNAFLSPLGQIGSGFSQAVSGLSSAAVQGGSNIMGQLTNVAGQVGIASAKNTGITAGTNAGVEKPVTETGDDGAVQTRPASAPYPYSPSFSHPERAAIYSPGDDTSVQQTGLALPGGGALSSFGAASPPTKIQSSKTFKVVETTDKQEQELPPPATYTIEGALPPFPTTKARKS